MRIAVPGRAADADPPQHLYSGVRIAKLVALDDDVPLSARKGKVIVRSGKGETSREIPLLDGTARTSITEWRTDRASWPGADTPSSGT